MRTTGRPWDRVVCSARENGMPSVQTTVCRFGSFRGSVSCGAVLHARALKLVMHAAFRGSERSSETDGRPLDSFKPQTA